MRNQLGELSTQVEALSARKVEKGKPPTSQLPSDAALAIRWPRAQVAFSLNLFDRSDVLAKRRASQLRR